MAREKILEVENLTINFKTEAGLVQAVRGVDFDLKRGETLAIVGESGSGKSVTNKAIMGILAANSIIEKGKIIYNGLDLTTVSEEQFHKIRGNKIGMIFQDPLSSLNPIMKIGKQITESIVLNGNHLKNMYYEKINDESAHIAYIHTMKDYNIKQVILNSKEELENAVKNKDKIAISNIKNKRKADIKVIVDKYKVDIVAAKKSLNIAKKRASAEVSEFKKNVVSERKQALIVAKKSRTNAFLNERKVFPVNLKAIDDKIAATKNNGYLEELESKYNSILDTKIKKAESAYNPKAAIKNAKMEVKNSKKEEIRKFNKIIDELKAERKKIIKAHRENLKEIRRIVFYEKEKFDRKLKVSHREAKEIALSIMKEVGIPQPEKRYKQYPFQFSGGMRQRIVIAIALTQSPEILICDEPTTALDVTIQAQILDLINELKVNRNISVIFITHDLGVVANMADKVAVMYAGKIVEKGTVNEIFYDPRHPYTWALLASMPDLNSKDKLDAIPGTPPNMIFPPKGDAFAARNKYALKIDFEKQPPFFKISDTHYAATWLEHKLAPKVEMPKIVAERIKNAKERMANINEEK